MTFAHLPAGYITCRLLFRRFEHRLKSYETYLFWGMFASIFPDFDYFYMRMFDPETHNHHAYFTHFPLFWIVLLILSYLWLHVDHRRQAPVSFLLFSLGGFIHMVLDTIPYKLRWLAPFSQEPYGLDRLFGFEEGVLGYNPPLQYTLEVLICCWAFWLLHTSRVTSARKL